MSRGTTHLFFITSCGESFPFFTLVEVLLSPYLVFPLQSSSEDLLYAKLIFLKTTRMCRLVLSRIEATAGVSLFIFSTSDFELTCESASCIRVWHACQASVSDFNCVSPLLSLSLSLNLSTAAFVESVSQRAMSQVVRGSRVARIKIKGRSIMLFKQERIGKQQETPDRHVLSIVFSMDPPFVVPLFTIFSLRVPSFKIDVKMISFPFHFIVLFENVFNPLSNRS